MLILNTRIIFIPEHKNNNNPEHKNNINPEHKNSTLV